MQGTVRTAAPVSRSGRLLTSPLSLIALALLSLFSLLALSLLAFPRVPLPLLLLPVGYPRSGLGLFLSLPLWIVGHVSAEYDLSVAAANFGSTLEGAAVDDPSLFCRVPKPFPPFKG